MAKLNRTLVYVFTARNIFTDSTRLVKFRNEVISKNGKLTIPFLTKVKFLLGGEVLNIRHAQSLKTGRMVGMAQTSSRRNISKRFISEVA